MRIYQCLFVWAIAQFNSPLQARESCEWKSWQELARTAVEESPQIKTLKADEAFRLSQGEAARVTPSALANAQYVAGGMPWKSSNLEASYLWTIERSGKREARMAAAHAGVESTQLGIADRKAQIVLKIALVQQALRTMDSRREVLVETQETYKKIIKQYESRLTLGPEQEASLAVFKIAKKENDLKIEAIEVEKDQYANQLNATLGCRASKLPQPKDFKLERPLNESIDSQSPALQKLNADSRSFELSAKSEIESYRSDYSVGPMVIAERKDHENAVQIGIAASFPIEGSRPAILSSSKTAEYKARQAEIELGIKEIELEREGWLSQYSKSVRALKGGLTPDEISKTHRKLEGLFRGERVSAALIIESHRQLLDHITSVTDLESKATEALWNIRYLDGNIKWSDL